MGIANSDIYEELEYKFLYQNDLNSIHVLLNLYDLDKNIRNIYPKYISIKNLEENLYIFFKEDKCKDKICSILSLMLHEDINRLELYICLKGYKSGYFNRCLANRLEDITIDNIPTEEIYNSKYLYHHEFNFNDEEEIRDEFIARINEDFMEKRFIDKIEKYHQDIIKPNIDKVNEEIKDAIGNDNIELAHEEIEDLNEFILNMLKTNMVKLYTESYWYGLNDRVLKRYR